MKTITHNDVEWLADKFFLKIVKAIEADEDFIICSTPERCRVLHKRSGDEYIGFVYHYITIAYQDFYYCIEIPNHFLFTDEGCATVTQYLKTGDNLKRQIRYPMPFVLFETVMGYGEEAAIAAGIRLVKNLGYPLQSIGRCPEQKVKDEVLKWV